MKFLIQQTYHVYTLLLKMNINLYVNTCVNSYILSSFQNRITNVFSKYLTYNNSITKFIQILFNYWEIWYCWYVQNILWKYWNIIIVYQVPVDMVTISDQSFFLCKHMHVHSFFSQVPYYINWNTNFQYYRKKLTHNFINFD